MNGSHTSSVSQTTSSAVNGILPSTGSFSSSVSSTGNVERRSDDVIGLVQDLSKTMSSATEEIYEINARTKLLALNARIEAARAGVFGAAFGVVAAEMQRLAGSTAEAASQMATRTQSTIEKLIDTIGTSVRGKRLSDMALVNIDLIDRNLYERSCDVRWWATDSSAVDALSSASSDSAEYACQRLGTILNSYTVYWDILLCDTAGKVIANGRPQQYRSIGRDVSRSHWFMGAMTTRSGDAFAFESAHRSNFVDNELALIYSAAVRRGGASNGAAIGVLGIIFNWHALAESVMKNTPISNQERKATRLIIADEHGKIVADSRGKELQESIPQAWLNAVNSEGIGFKQVSFDGSPHCIGFAKAPGYETYSTNWNSFIVQPLSH